MKPIQALAVALLAATLTACTTPQSTIEPVTVWHEATYVTKADGTQVRKVDAIPWVEGLTLMRAISSTGGYTTPPTRNVYLVRNSSSTILDMRGISKQTKPDIRLKPGDRIELRR